MNNPATNDPSIYTLADKLIGLPHEVGIFGVPVHDMGMTQRIMQMSAHLAAAGAEIERLSADNEALRRVAFAAHALRSVFHDTDAVGEALEVAEQPWKDILDERLEALPEHITATFSE